ncbi:invasion associated locus B family protein [Bradyrhizobium acaciae]|uniref:invasion associated locus B family protein n=1 Tax=Bradyrhizobium acaciae TaxID=2683706 RepID=UPI0030840173|nr:invasion associated locus B family protein [Bradyrhizobium acaciae]
MKIVAKSLVVLFSAFGLAGHGHAQAPKGKTTTVPVAAAAPAAPQGDAASPNNTGWVARCTSASREAPLECAMEQTAVLTKTGQLIVLVNIRVPGDTRTPIALIQLPLGLNLPVGAKLQVDDGKAVDVPIQTCEARGCYINAPITADVLTQLKSGKQLKVSFQNLGKETISIPMPLADFATVYDKIK